MILYKNKGNTAELLKDKRVIEVSSLAGNSIVIVKRKDYAKWELNPSP